MAFKKKDSAEVVTKKEIVAEKKMVTKKGGKGVEMVDVPKKKGKLVVVDTEVVTPMAKVTEPISPTSRLMKKVSDSQRSFRSRVRCLPRGRVEKNTRRTPKK